MAQQLSDEDIIHNVRTRSDGAEWLLHYINQHWKTQSCKMLRKSGANDNEAVKVLNKSITALYYNLVNEDFRAESALKTYFIEICIRQLARLIRENIRDREKDPEKEVVNHRHPEFELERQQLSEILKKCLNELAYPCRDIVRLKWLEGWGLEAIARHLGTPLQYVKNRSVECRERLQERLKKYGYGRQ